jgi:hypothetical protein
MRIRRFSIPWLWLVVLATLFSAPARANHAAAGNCAHTHFDRTHGECNDGVTNTACTVGGKAGICVQTSSNCQCRVKNSTSALQETGISVLDGLLQNIVEAKSAKSALGSTVAQAELNALFQQLSEGSAALSALGGLDVLADVGVGAKLDRIAANLAPVQKILLAGSSVPRRNIKNEINAIRGLVQQLKQQWAAAVNGQ